MSDTSPKNQDALTAGYKSKGIPRVARHGKELWRLKQDGVILRCELLDDSAINAGFEVVLRRNEELFLGRRCGTRAAAEYAAQVIKQDQIRTGWQEHDVLPGG